MNVLTSRVFGAYPLFILVLSVGMVGCRTIVVHSEAESFFLKHPLAKQEYVRLEPTSLFMLQQQLASRNSQVRQAINGFRAIIKTNNVSIDWMESVAGAIYDDYREPILQLEREMQRCGGHIYFFELNTGAEGYVIINNGEIEYRVPFVRGMDLK